MPPSPVPAENAWAGRALIIGLNLSILAAYLTWSASRSDRIDSESGCVICFSPHDSALIYAVVFVGPVLIVSIAIALHRYGRRRKVLHSGKRRSESLGPAAIDAIWGLGIGLLTMTAFYLSIPLISWVRNWP